MRIDRQSHFRPEHALPVSIS